MEKHRISDSGPAASVLSVDEIEQDLSNAVQSIVAYDHRGSIEI
jgi:hypothetical protein